MTDQHVGAGRPDDPPAVIARLTGDPRDPVWHPPDRCLYRDLLCQVIDPELGVNIIDLGLVYDLRVADGVAQVRMTMTTPGCPLGAYFDDAIGRCLAGAPGVEGVDLEIVWDPPWRPEMMSDTAKEQLGWRR
jgi:metal-sulfur cluster biosynthetic enzyme